MQIIACNQLSNPIYPNRKKNVNFQGILPSKTNNLHEIKDTFTKNIDVPIIKEVPKKYLQTLKERFFKEYTESKVLEMRNRYQEIMKISDTDEFLKSLCQELTKDYGIEKIPLRLKTNSNIFCLNDDFAPQGRCTPRYEHGFIEISINKYNTKEELFLIMAHELRHIFQNMICYQHSSNKEYAEVLLEKGKQVHPDYHLTDEEILNIHINPYVETMDTFYKDLGINKLDKKEPTYKYGRRILNSHRQDANKDAETYDMVYYERDAMRTAVDLYNILFEKKMYY